ncbi:type VI secretion system baseplate subunit TssG [Mucilaginibacter sp. cycad4]|uniref:type VI secretion system baseplate subunit TssG n=1 Tax=Mucilaginibacter sp. cycad4 TaxID=3342096 RepID=UPI002AAC2980|nr:type VI secretion system baseplate subunit TssG [Mucilaginibacter gossypii]WPU97493.1 type VI secretion system baseplate subunit TssG [Mucilaginibacter gossypii]
MRIKKPNQIDTDYKATTIAAEIIENEMVSAGDVMILPKGPKKRAYDKEIAGITVDKKNEGKKPVTTILVNRDGFYDMLPEGLFHRPPASSVMITEEDMIKDIKARREEEKQTRRFFAPFEAELNYFRTMVELYENRLDKKNEYDELINIFLKEWQEFECFTKKQMLILIHVLPVIHEQRNNIGFVSSIINMMFSVPLSLHYKTVYPKQKNGAAINGGGTALGAGALGVNFIAGQIIEAGQKLVMNIGPVSAARMLEFLPGTSAAKAIDVLLSYFIPLGAGVQFNLVADQASQRLVIGGAGANATLGYTTYLG